MNRNLFFLLQVLLASAVTTGCHRSAAIRETYDADGFPRRVEMEEQEEGLASATEIRDRLASHVERKNLTPMRARPGGTAAVHAAPLAAGDDFDPFVERGCPPEGSATNEKQERLNRLKNRSSEPTAADLDPAVSLTALRKRGNDRDRWSTGSAATIEGYVRSAKGTGAESCNCKETNRKLTDTHLDIVTDDDDTRKPVIAEITPVFRLLHEHYGLEDWSSGAIKAKYEGQRVRITGWLFFDEAHLYEADNTDRLDARGKKNWRATCWEIHPITNIELVDD